jgi:hypothetical protein
MPLILSKLSVECVVLVSGLGVEPGVLVTQVLHHLGHAYVVSFLMETRILW